MHPWYHRPTFWSRWGPLGLLTRLAGGTVPSRKTSGMTMMPEGFLFEDLGPLERMGKGRDKTEAEEARLKRERPSGCPFA